MRTLIRHLLIISVLFMSAEGAWDQTNEVHPHGDNYAHQSDMDDQLPVQPEPPLDSGDTHCGHLCHGHMSSLVLVMDNFSLAQSGDYYAFQSTALSNRLTAPPTPPPNA